MEKLEKLRKTVLELAEPLVKSAHLEIWGLDIVPGPQLKVRLFIDVPANEAASHSTSASIEQCEEISRQLGAALEVEDIIPDRWVLEVSSPGLERKFYNPGQMRPYLGDLLDVRLSEPLPETPSRKSFKGRLTEVADGGFELMPCSIDQSGNVRPDGEENYFIPWDHVNRVARIHLFTIPQKPGKQPGKAGENKNVRRSNNK